MLCGRCKYLEQQRRFSIFTLHVAALFLLMFLNNTCCHRLRAANVLLIGLGGLGIETAKNVILAGVNSITFLDHRDVTDLDKCSQFFVPKEDIGKNVNIKLQVASLSYKYHPLLQTYRARERFFRCRELKHRWQGLKTWILWSMSAQTQTKLTTSPMNTLRNLM